MDQRSASPTVLVGWNLGRLEKEVMEVVWTTGRCTVKGVLLGLARPLAYTTVETTLTRLVLKGLLDREKQGRSYVFSPRISFHEWASERTRRALADGLRDLQNSPHPELIVSHLIAGIAAHDAALLDVIEAEIRKRTRGRK